MIIKNFKGSGYENTAGDEEFRISWDYNSLENGNTIGPKNFAIPNNLITEEFVLGWNFALDLPLYFTAGDPVENPIAWYNDSFFLEYYFTHSEYLLVRGDLELRVPNTYNSTEVTAGTIMPLEQFRVQGKNFPGQVMLAGKTATTRYPGLIAQAGSTPTQDRQSNSIFNSLTSYFTDEIEKHEWCVRNAWETSFGPHSGTAFSLNMFGLDRADYAFAAEQLIKDSVIATLPTATVTPTNYVYLALDTYGNLAVSLNSLTDFKYGQVATPADLGVTIVDFTLDRINPTKTVIYGADGLEGTTLSHTSLTGLVQAILLGPDRFEPEVTLTNTVASTEFRRGFKYRYPSSQTSFPPGFISITATTGKFPYNTARPYNIKPHSFGIFNGKNTRHAAEFFFKLFRLRRGGEYNNTLDIISTGPNDLDILELWDLPALVVESLNDNNFVAGGLVGYDTNSVSVRLPFSYARGQKEWVLAHKICEAFLQNYTIGYHEFVADFSAADEPVFLSSVLVTDFRLSSDNMDEEQLSPFVEMLATNANLSSFAFDNTGISDNSSFIISGSTLTFDGTPNYEVKSSYTVKLKVASTSGEFSFSTFVININNINEGPTAITAAGVPIHQPAGATFAPGQSYVPASPNLIQDSAGQITFIPGGGGGGGLDGTGGYGASSLFTDVATGQSFLTLLVLETNPNPTVIATLGNDDPDVGAISVYSLVSGAGDSDNALFSITSNTLSINVTTDYNIKKEYFIRVRVTTDGGLFTEITLRVNVVRLATPPTDIVLFPTVLPSLNQSIGALSVVDNNLFGVYNYSIIGGGLASKLAITSPNILKLQNALDGSEAAYTVEVQAIDETNLTYHKLISITYDSKPIHQLAAIGETNSFYIPITTQTKQELVVKNIPILSVASSTSSFNLLN